MELCLIATIPAYMLPRIEARGRSEIVLPSGEVDQDDLCATVAFHGGGFVLRADSLISVTQLGDWEIYAYQGQHKGRTPAELKLRQAIAKLSKKERREVLASMSK